MSHLDREFTISVRIRPSLISGAPTLVKATSNTSLIVEQPRKSFITRDSIQSHVFNVHRVFDVDSSTEQIFESLVAPLIPFVIKGGFSSIMAYGQTGSGKSFTLSYLSTMVAASLFQQKGNEVMIHVSCIELYGNAINDLLDLNNTQVCIIEDMQGAVQFKHCTQRCCSTLQQLLETFHEAWSSRKTFETFKNDQSSRSHAIIRLTFKPNEITNATPGVLQLIDLAGSERASSDVQNNNKERLREGVFINKTLMTLKDCIRQRSLSGLSSTSQHIPYRGSKLTLSLKESFELSSRQPSHTLFIATVTPLLEDLSATINTLRYASSLSLAPKKMIIEESDPADVTFWSHGQVLEWLQLQCGISVQNPLLIAPFENGLSLSRVPESEFTFRLLKASNGKLGEKRARNIYLAYWDLIVRARTRKRDLERRQWEKEFRNRRKNQEERFERDYLNALTRNE